MLVVAYMGSRYKVAGANEALIVSGRRERGPGRRGPQGRPRPGRHRPAADQQGRTAPPVRPPDQRAALGRGHEAGHQGRRPGRRHGQDRQRRGVDRAAAERFLEREDQIDSIVKNVLEGSLRSIVGTLTVEELNYDRAKFQQEVQSAARSDLATSGLTIDNFTIQAIRDEVGYMDLIGQQETARRERDARMAKATADQEAAVREPSPSRSS